MSDDDQVVEKKEKKSKKSKSKGKDKKHKDKSSKKSKDKGHKSKDKGHKSKDKDKKSKKKDKKSKDKDKKSKDKGHKSKDKGHKSKDKDKKSKDKDKNRESNEFHEGEPVRTQSSRSRSTNDGYDFKYQPNYKPTRQRGDPETDIKKLIKYAEKSHRSPLIEAIYAERPDLIEPIVSKGHNVNAQEKKTEETPILFAIKHGYFDSVNVLLGKRPDLNISDRKGTTPLHSAVYLNQLSLAEELIKGGAVVDSQDKTMTTPLMIAARKGGLTMVKLLLQNGANPGARDSNNKTALQYAQDENYVPIVSILARATEGGSIGGDSTKSDSKHSLAASDHSAGNVGSNAEGKNSTESFLKTNYSTSTMNSTNTMNIDDPEPEIQSFCQQGKFKLKHYWKASDELRKQAEREGPQSSTVTIATKKFEAEMALLDKQIREFRLAKGMGEYAYRRLPFES